VLGGFANDLRKAPPGQATPRSVSAVGYKALADYLERLDYHMEETRGKRAYYERSNRLVIYTPSRPLARVKRSLKAQGRETSLIILPKWQVRKYIAESGQEKRTGWVRKSRGSGLYYESLYRNMIDGLPVVQRSRAQSIDAKVSFETPKNRLLSKGFTPDFEDLQYFDLTTEWTDYVEILDVFREAEAEERRRKIAEERGDKYEPKKKKKSDKKETEADEESEDEAEPLPNHEVLMRIEGHPVLIRLEDTETYILSDPDLMNTMAFKKQGGAQLASAIIDDVIEHAEVDVLSVDFDVSLHGIQSSRNIIKLMVTPPFLAATLCLLAAGGLVAWQGYNRFGDPARVRPDYAQGPVSLAQTAAEFMAEANRAHRTGEAYAELVKRQVIKQLGIKARKADYIDELLEARETRLKIQPTYEDLKRAISGAEPQSYGQYARALTTWRGAMTETDLQAQPAPPPTSDS